MRRRQKRRLGRFAGVDRVLVGGGVLGVIVRCAGCIVCYGDGVLMDLRDDAKSTSTLGLEKVQQVGGGGVGRDTAQSLDNLLQRSGGVAARVGGCCGKGRGHLKVGIEGFFCGVGLFL